MGLGALARAWWLVDAEMEAFGEERPAIETVPIVLDRPGHGQFHVALLEMLQNVVARCRA